MKIKRVFASDMRQAMRLVREEHGADAVILSSRPVDGGVEVISAIDYDENAVREAAAQQPPATAEPARRSAPSFAETLARAGGRADAAPASSAPAEAPGRFSVTVGDGDDGIPSLSFEDQMVDAATVPDVQEESAPAPSAGRARAPEARIEWSQEPAMQAMRDELRTLRSLFQNQLSLMEWQQLGQRQPVRQSLLRQLHDMGLGPDVCRRIADNVSEPDNLERAVEQALQILAHNLPVADDDVIEQGGVVAAIGPTGVGKTTTVAKLAARYALRHGKRHVALVTTDNFRVGGQEQLRSFARILGVPVHAASDGAELEAVLGDLADKSLVLVDTAGMSQRDMRLAEQFRTLTAAKRSIRPYLVVSANTQISALMETLRYFRKVKPAGCIISKSDEAASLGAVLTALLRSRLPVAYVAHGQRVPEDLRTARGDRLIAEARALGQRLASQDDDESLAVTFGGH